MTTRLFTTALALLAVTGCLNPNASIESSEQHLVPEVALAPETDVDSEVAEIPAVVSRAASLPVPEPVEATSAHTVVVYDVPVNELLFSLARDSKLNLDIDPGITGTVSLNAIEQPLSAILNRISEVANIRYEINNNVLRVRQDLPFIRSYAVDYLNIARTSVGSVAVSTQISSTGQGAGGDGAGSGGDAGNSSDTIVRNVTDHAFWATLEDNIGRILNRPIDEGSEGQNSDIIVNSESGTLAVRATEREHEDVAKFIAQVQVSTQRQVLIEATIA